MSVSLAKVVCIVIKTSDQSMSAHHATELSMFCVGNPEVKLTSITVDIVTITNYSDYKSIMGNELLKKFVLKDYGSIKSKGSIGRLITLQKCELIKSISKRYLWMYQKISTWEKRGISKQGGCFTIKEERFFVEESWYNNNGSAYNPTKKFVNTNVEK